MKTKNMGKTILAFTLALTVGAVAVTSGAANVTAQTQKSFAASELAKYNGKNGAAAYIAVDGMVYDVTTYFTGGRHHGAVAGTDQSAAFHDEHSKSQLELAKVVGVLKTDTVPVKTPAPVKTPVSVKTPAPVKTPPPAPALAGDSDQTRIAALIAELDRLDRQEQAIELRQDEIKRELYSLNAGYRDDDDHHDKDEYHDKDDHRDDDYDD